MKTKTSQIGLLAFCVSALASLTPLAGAVITNFSADFDTYTLGSVSSQSGSGQVGAGGWVVPATALGNVTLSPDPIPQVGSQALGFSRPSGTSGLTAPLGTNLNISTSGLVYFAFDLYKPADTGGGTFQLQSSARSFGVFINGGANSSLEVNQDNTVRVNTGFSIATDTWYRLEFNITKSGSGNTGNFDLFISSPAAARQLLLDNVAYAFNNSVQTIISANTIGTGATREMFAQNILLQSNLDDFPVNPIPEISSGAGVMLGLVFILAISGLRRRRGVVA